MECYATGCKFNDGTDKCTMSENNITLSREAVCEQWEEDESSLQPK
ncbi:hypothetical protein LCGC14_0359210 [marine sediment metagenome]|uniref:DUF1540 domain-containing protein n=1 Tax=marine sediment metagenome TaxID=412755 RepID=A0A0F9VVN3_9ZZZZ